MRTVMTLLRVGIEYLDNYDMSWGQVDKGHANDAGIDLRACFREDKVIIQPGEMFLVPLGIKTNIPAGFEAQLRARSGLAARHGIGLVNGVGTIDAGYCGEWGAIVINHGKGPYIMRRGDRVAQAVFHELPDVILVTENVTSDNDRGGGFGSTGVN